MKTQRAHQVVGVRCGLEAPLKKNLGTFGGGGEQKKRKLRPLKKCPLPLGKFALFSFSHLFFFFSVFLHHQSMCVVLLFLLITTCFSLVLFYFASKCGWVGERMNGESERHWRRDNRTKKWPEDEFIHFLLPFFPPITVCLFCLNKKWEKKIVSS